MKRKTAEFNPCEAFCNPRNRCAIKASIDHQGQYGGTNTRPLEAPNMARLIAGYCNPNSLPNLANCNRPTEVTQAIDNVYFDNPKPPEVIAVQHRLALAIQETSPLKQNLV